MLRTSAAEAPAMLASVVVAESQEAFIVMIGSKVDTNEVSNISNGYTEAHYKA